MRGFEVAEASEHQLDAVLSCYQWLFAPPGARPSQWDPDRARKALAEAIDGDASTVLVALDGDSLVGICTAYLDLHSVRYGPRCWVEDLAVDPGRRSAGVGKALLDAAKAWGRQRGATHLELDSGEARVDAHRFYEREGPAWRSKQYTWEL